MCIRASRLNGWTDSDFMTQELVNQTCCVLFISISREQNLFFNMIAGNNSYRRVALRHCVCVGAQGRSTRCSWLGATRVNCRPSLRWGLDEEMWDELWTAVSPINVSAEKTYVLDSGSRREC